MHALKNTELDSVVKRLDAAISDHRKWLKMLMRSLCCRLKHSIQDLSEDAHHQCTFAKWYYDNHPTPLKRNVHFKAIEQQHIDVHVSAARMMNRIKAGNNIPTADFDEFSYHLEKFEQTLEQLKSEILELLYHRDPLTGAYDRAALSEELYQFTLERQVNKPTASIIMLDIDKFKLINDNYGHHMGDLVLEKISSYILSELRGKDKFFRFGGEEFIILLSDTNINEATIIAERIRKGLAGIRVSDGSRTVTVTASFGVATMEHTNDISIENADKALYQAKRSGRNNVVTYHENRR